MSEPYIIGLFTLAGTGLGALIMFAAADRTARIEERKHFRELGLKVAMTKFEGCSKLADATGKLQDIPPFEAFVLEGIKFMDIVSTPGLSAVETAKRLTELRDFSKTVDMFSNKKGTLDA
jgi:hypothetical protein